MTFDDKASLEFAFAVVGIDGMLAAAAEWLGEHADPGDVFSNEKLEAWARARGYQVPE